MPFGVNRFAILKINDYNDNYYDINNNSNNKNDNDNNVVMICAFCTEP